jgi:hypothetical protein
MLLLVAMLAACEDCHPQFAARWAESPMAHSSGMTNATAEFSGKFYNESSRAWFEIRRAAGKLKLILPEQEQSLDFYIGSRRVGRSYGFIEDGYLYQAPVGYYSLRRAWGMAPGYEHDSTPDLNRPVTADCLFCHASGMIPAHGTLNRYQDLSRLRGITCERCHGAGAEHAARPRPDNIVNPARLTGSRRDSICEQCHLSGEVRLQTARRTLSDFRPGEDLADYLAVFVATSAGRVRVNSHAEALARSRCRQAAGERLWCGTCHDPHGSAATNYARVCTTCHEPRQCPVAARESANQSDCIVCHMPKSQAADGGHTVFTDHSIPRSAGPRQQLRIADLQPYFVRPQDGNNLRNTGLAYAAEGRRLNRADWLQKAWPLLRQAAIEGAGDPALYTEIARFLDAAGKRDEAIRYYRLSLELDGAQFDALVNLARLLAQKGQKTEAAALDRRAAAACPRCSRQTRAFN